MTEPAHGSLNHEPGQAVVLPPPSRSQVVATTITTVATAMGATVATVACAAEHLSNFALTVVAVAGYSSTAAIGKRLMGSQGESILDWISAKDVQTDDEGVIHKLKERDRKTEERKAVLALLASMSIRPEVAERMMREIAESEIR